MRDPIELAPIGECRLDQVGLRRQRDRYAALGRQATAIRREPGRLTVEFDTTLDRHLLREAVRVERECCPFFQMTLGEERPELTVSVSHADHEPALDAIAYALQTPVSPRPAGREARARPPRMR